MGYSFGGWLTVSLLSRHAARFNSAVVGGAGLAGADGKIRAQTAAALQADDPSTITSEGGRAIRQLAEMRNNDLHALAAMQPSERTPPSEAALRQLALPLLVVVGDGDPAMGTARELAEIVPGARLEVLPGANHSSAVADARFKRVVGEFLAEASPAREDAVIQKL
jgi:pimeloyl-ACP methyl ester carboxylesterase